MTGKSGYTNTMEADFGDGRNNISKKYTGHTHTIKTQFFIICHSNTKRHLRIRIHVCACMSYFIFGYGILFCKVEDNQSDC